MQLLADGQMGRGWFISTHQVCMVRMSGLVVAHMCHPLHMVHMAGLVVAHMCHRLHMVQMVMGLLHRPTLGCCIHGKWLRLAHVHTPGMHGTDARLGGGAHV